MGPVLEGTEGIKRAVVIELRVILEEFFQLYIEALQIRIGKSIRLEENYIEKVPSCLLTIFTNPSTRAGYDTRSIFYHLVY